MACHKFKIIIMYFLVVDSNIYYIVLFFLKHRLTVSKSFNIIEKKHWFK